MSNVLKLSSLDQWSSAIILENSRRSNACQYISSNMPLKVTHPKDRELCQSYFAKVFTRRGK